MMQDEHKYSILRPAVMTFCVASATLLLQMAQTRIYSVVFWNHLVYFIISIALLGFGISGTWLSFGESTRGARVLTFSKAAWSFAVSAAFSCLLVPKLGISIAEILHDATALLQLLFTYAAAVFPFFFAGWILGMIYRDHARSIHALYFADLFGAAAGCLLFLGLIGPMGAVGLVVVTCALGALPVIALSQRASAAWGSAAALALGLALLFIARDRFEAAIVPEPTKSFNTLYADLTSDDAKVVEFSKWNTMSRTNVVSTRKNPEVKRIFLDGDAWTPMVVNPPAVYPPFNPQQDRLLSYQSPYLLRPGPESVLIIGSGGGADIRQALRGGATKIDAVEINPSTVHLVLNEYRAVNNDHFRRPGVTLWKEEGRSFVRRSGRTYDVIMLNAIDTFAALNAGAYMLSENYLYTVDAVKDYLARLSPKGILCIARWEHDAESLRLFVVILEALKEMGYPEPEKHIQAHSSDYWLAVLASPTAFSEEELAVMDHQIRIMSGTPYYPLAANLRETLLQRAINEYAETFTNNRHEAFLAEYRFDVRPVRDDSPFFFHYERSRNLQEILSAREVPDLVRGYWGSATLMVLLVVMLTAVIVFMFVPLLGRQRGSLPRFPAWLAYFALLGLSFIFVEIALMQRFALLLGHPSRSVALVLAALLFFAGVGSYSRERFGVRLTPALGVLVLLLVLTAFLYPKLTVLALGFPLWLRGLVTVILVAVPAVLMGMPFPWGIRAVSGCSKESVPWMLGVNGGCTVLGSILAIICAMNANFTTVLVLAALGYLCAMVLARRLQT